MAKKEQRGFIHFNDVLEDLPSGYNIVNRFSVYWMDFQLGSNAGNANE
jgi:hypothetical protein